MNKQLYVHASDVKFQKMTSRYVAIYYADDVNRDLIDWADRIETAYGQLPSTKFPGPPTSIVAEMRAAAGKSGEQK